AAIITAADDQEIGAAAGFVPAFIPEESPVPEERSHQDHITEELPDLNTDEMPHLGHEHDNGSFTEPAEARESSADEMPTNEHQLSSLVSGEFDELVELITRRVVERVSDRAIREIAQEAVPRIAEKLMREALEEDRNK
ncbi:MAG: hypothetical protein JO314_09930, partial [Acidobacteria bacterium]|nr:hypothetical protein [Acidobacteriota bacterium]